MAGKVIICPTCNERIEDTLRITKPKLLIVEGRDEEEFFGPMLAELGIKDIQVAGIGGKEKLRGNLKALKTTDPGFSVLTSLGIARDADNDAKGAFQSVQDALKSAGLPCPEEPMHATATGSPRVSVMIVPPNEDRGALESLCIGAVDSDPAMVCVDQYFECLDTKGGGRPKKDFVKAKARVFLSSRREDPTVSVGIAAQKRYWPFEAAIFDSVKEFLKSL
jgi:hypothetical protein